MFITYFCKDGTRVEIDEFSDRESAEKAVQSYYDDDIDVGEFEDAVYGITDTDDPQDWAVERVRSDNQPEEEDDDDDD